MLDSVLIINPGGIVYWKKDNLKKELLNSLIQTVFIQEKEPDNYILKYKRKNEMIFIAIHSRQFALPFVDDLLEAISAKYVVGSDFDSEYSAILKGMEKTKVVKQPKAFEESDKFKNTLRGSNEVKSPKPFQKKDKQVKKTGKEGRAWDASGAASTASTTKLDFSSEDSASAVSKSLIGKGLQAQSDGTVNAMELDVPTLEPTKSSIFSMFSNLTAKPLTEEDLVKPMLKMKEHLVNKNVAADIAQKLCDTVEKGLIGTSVSKLSSIDVLIKKEMTTALSKILTPITSTNILHEIAESKEREEPYSIAFIGVNGVGKSTNLSKICFWLLQNKLSVLIAAGDTFRSGAVEQLKVHVRNLCALEEGARLELFDKGYGKDPAGIAKDAIKYAKNEGFDVVLIDTAGRMQDNEPLMRALAKLVTENNPNKIIFVGEALVGTQSISQLTKFNQSLKDFSYQANPRQIDGMILTKFDTIDDKVGAALSMTYITGKPILFVGTGQTYTDLRRMNVNSIVNTLLKD
ncbi:hypothetical protein HK103_006319 [Boothiomyces macroporosus]|uniref:SRP54-type proteins GTP-binding domain-containing protein n=1 Tax=Boothiomyces macroporosus TaxID=261099 RepID=A0AAD5UH28_9FUNG|nr:hypothetical protein HK103_006319 [Boothiomyces macroporosus]